MGGGDRRLRRRRRPRLVRLQHLGPERRRRGQLGRHRQSPVSQPRRWLLRGRDRGGRRARGVLGVGEHLPGLRQRRRPRPLPGQRLRQGRQFRRRAEFVTDPSVLLRGQRRWHVRRARRRAGRGRHRQGPRRRRLRLRSRRRSRPLRSQQRGPGAPVPQRRRQRRPLARRRAPRPRAQHRGHRCAGATSPPTAAPSCASCAPAATTPRRIPPWRTSGSATARSASVEVVWPDGSRSIREDVAAESAAGARAAAARRRRADAAAARLHPGAQRRGRKAGQRGDAAPGRVRAEGTAARSPRDHRSGVSGERSRRSSRRRGGPHRVRRRPEVSAVADVRACRRCRRQRRHGRGPAPRGCVRSRSGCCPARRGAGSRGGPLSGGWRRRRWQRSSTPRCGRSTPAKPRGSGAAPSAARPSSPPATPRRRGRSLPGRWRRASGRSPGHAPASTSPPRCPGAAAHRRPRHSAPASKSRRRAARVPLSTAPIASAPHAIATRTASPRSTVAIGRSTQQSIARQWDEVLLDAIRRDTPRPTVHARNLFHLSGVMWDAWRAYGGGGSAWHHR